MGTLTRAANHVIQPSSHSGLVNSILVDEIYHSWEIFSSHKWLVPFTCLVHIVRRSNLWGNRPPSIFDTSNRTSSRDLMLEMMVRDLKLIMWGSTMLNSFNDQLLWGTQTPMSSRMFCTYLSKPVVFGPGPSCLYSIAPSLIASAHLYVCRHTFLNSAFWHGLRNSWHTVASMCNWYLGKYWMTSSTMEQLNGNTHLSSTCGGLYSTCLTQSTWWSQCREHGHTSCCGSCKLNKYMSRFGCPLQRCMMMVEVKLLFLTIGWATSPCLFRTSQDWFILL